MHWAEAYLGKPWESGAQGPDSYNCWGLVRAVAKAQFGYEPPLIAIDENQGISVRKAFKSHPEHNKYLPVNTPKAGDIVELGTKKDLWHVGIWLDVDSGGVLHSVQGSGVIFNDLRHLKLMGFTQLNFWRFNACKPA